MVGPDGRRKNWIDEKFYQNGRKDSCWWHIKDKNYIEIKEDLWGLDFNSIALSWWHLSNFSRKTKSKSFQGEKRWFKA